jgi:predicted glutamine amidotransferase
MVYAGRKSKEMADLLTRQARSIVTQSLACRERELAPTSHLNADGFGVGWYSMNI